MRLANRCVDAALYMTDVQERDTSLMLGIIRSVGYILTKE